MTFENQNYKKLENHEINEQLFNDMIIELKLRNYSPKTIDTYLFQNIQFLKYCKKFPTQVQKNDIDNYLKQIILEKKLSPAYYNLAKNALLFYYKQIRNKRFNINSPTAKLQNRIPFVLSVEEIKKMIDATPNSKHKLLIKILYSSGLRVSECIKLKFCDIDLNNKMGFVNSGKGNKDRLFYLSDSVISDIKELQEFMSKQNIFSEYLFYCSLDYSKHITVRTAQIVVKRAAKKSKINKRVHCHLLRACFATHMIENNIEINIVQSLLGHSKIETTQRYIRSSKKMFDNLPNLI